MHWFCSCNRNSGASGYCLIDPVLVRHYKGDHEETKPQSDTVHIDRSLDINQGHTGVIFSLFSLFVSMNIKAGKKKNKKITIFQTTSHHNIKNIVLHCMKCNVNFEFTFSLSEQIP